MHQCISGLLAIRLHHLCLWARDWTCREDSSLGHSCVASSHVRRSQVPSWPKPITQAHCKKHLIEIAHVVCVRRIHSKGLGNNQLRPSFTHTGGGAFLKDLLPSTPDKSFVLVDHQSLTIAACCSLLRKSDSCNHAGHHYTLRVFHSVVFSVVLWPRRCLCMCLCVCMQKNLLTALLTDPLDKWMPLF